MKFTTFIQIDDIHDLKKLHDTIREHITRSFSSIDDLIRNMENDFIPGKYFIWLEESWDRTGDCSIQVLVPIPENIENIKDITSKVDELLKKYVIPAKKLDRLYCLREHGSTDEYLKALSEYSEHNAITVKETHEKLDDLGLDLL